MLAQGSIKICSSCKQTLSIHAFNKNKCTKDNLQNACKTCKAKITKNWKYSIKSGHYEKMRVNQNNSCAICFKKEQELVIDHCHKTEKLRNLLCRKCNALLGMCDDDLKILKSAQDYIIKWTEE